MDVKLPKLGEGADSGSVVGVLVKVGQVISAGQTILELENEKAIATIPSSAAGRVTQIYVKEGETVSVGQRILALEEVGETSAMPVSAAAPPCAEPRARGRILPSTKAPEPAVELEAPGATPSEIIPEVAALEDQATAKPGSPPPASPSIRKLARELGIDLRKVRGSERGGRIVMEDLKAYIQRLQQISFTPRVPAPQAAPPAASRAGEPIDFSQWGPITKKSMSALRQTIARRMVESWSTIPQVNQFDEADITDLWELRNKYSAAYESKGVRLTLTPFAMKATIAALQQSPIFNASFDEINNQVVFKEYYHIGIAVDTEAGLIVPVVREVDKKSLVELAQELQALVERTRARKVTPEDLKGGTFTISNQGGIGGGPFTPLINKPQSAILGLGRGILKPVMRHGQIVPRMMLPLCVSYDHRLIDGAQAAQFIVQLAQALEQFAEDKVAM
jgi:pyruvate dehydrogenase E2 component (dihydrolipoamide acetyltransferase)